MVPRRRRAAAALADAARRQHGVGDLHRLGVLASEIERYLGSIPSRIQVIPPGTPAPRVDAGSGSGREPLVLFVGSLFNRRRLPDLIAAFARATTAPPDARLVIVGDNRTWPRQDLRGSRPRTA